nr:MAG TPA: hypothetical protein [Caudoviricetes sp.]
MLCYNYNVISVWLRNKLTFSNMYTAGLSPFLVWRCFYAVTNVG